MAETTEYLKELLETTGLPNVAGRKDLPENYSKLVEISLEACKLLDRLEQAGKKIEQLKTTESLYAAATKALNSQLEINSKLQTKIEQQQKMIRELMKPAKGFEQIAELCGATMGPTQQIIAEAEELLK